MPEKKQRIVIDTNVIISSLITNSFSRNIVRELVLGNEVDLLISPSVVLEYELVMFREKFNKYKEFSNNAKILLDAIKVNSIILNPNKTLDILSDYDDNKFLELALEGKADFLITGNTKHFVIKEFQGIIIVTPKEYYHLYKLEHQVE